MPLLFRTALPSLMDPLPRLRRGVLDFLMVQQFPKDLQHLMVRVIHYHLLCHLDLQYLWVRSFRRLHLDLPFRLDLRFPKAQHLHLYRRLLKDLLHRKVQHLRLFPANLGRLKDLQLRLDLLRRMDRLFRSHLPSPRVPQYLWVRLFR